MLCVQDSVRRVLRHTDPDLLHQAEYVTIVFEDQKNGRDGCPQRRSGHKFLPYCAGDAIRRIIATIRLERADNAMLCHTRGARPSSGNAFVRKLLRHTCSIFGDLKHSGSTPRDRNKSIRSGPQWLFLMDLPCKIMILGRWSSDAFLVYIRQVLEWTNNMSCDMIHLDSFFDARIATSSRQMIPEPASDSSVLQWPRQHRQFRSSTFITEAVSMAGSISGSWESRA
jgi:hypothetical protein